MSATFECIKQLVNNRLIRISEHGYDELAADGIFVRDVIEGVAHGTVLEDYPQYPKGRCVLVLQTDRNGRPIHVVWGIPKERTEPAVVVTAYKPDPKLWQEGFTRRRK